MGDTKILPPGPPVTFSSIKKIKLMPEALLAGHVRTIEQAAHTLSFAIMLTTLNFAKVSPLFKTEVAYEMFGFPKYDSPVVTNVEVEGVNDILLQDIRDTPCLSDLETAGFKYFKHHSRCDLDSKHFEDANGKKGTAAVVLDYLDESIDLFKRHLGTERIVCFDWRLRRSTVPSLEPDVIQRFSDVHAVRSQAIPPGRTIHCDFSAQGGRERMAMHLLPEELEAIEQGNVKAKIFNLWRPLRPVKCAPIVLADRRTVKKSDLIEVQKVVPDKVEKAYYVMYQSHHSWFYMSNQTPDDPVMFVTWDLSGASEAADYPPHGAAWHDGSEEPRESVEVRCIALFDS